jgi:hypothetical protein
MELVINKQSFKAQAAKLHACLVSRGIESKLSDAYESLAVSLGFANLATLFASLKANDARVVDIAPFKFQTANQFVISWMFPEDGVGDEKMIVYPVGTTLADTASRDWTVLVRLRQESLFFPDDFELGPNTLAMDTYCIVPRPDRYGLPDMANPKAIKEHVLDTLGFRVPLSGVDTNFTDSGDDGGGIDNMLVWVSDTDAAKIRELFDTEKQAV